MRFHIVIRSAITVVLFDFRNARDICQSTNIQLLINGNNRRYTLESRRRMSFEIYEETSVSSYPQEDVAICASGFSLSIIQIEIIRTSVVSSPAFLGNETSNEIRMYVQCTYPHRALQRISQKVD